MTKWLKISVLVVVAIVAVAVMGSMRVKHNIQTTQYCSTCHVVSPYYRTWEASPFLANTHRKAGLVCQDCHERTLRAGLKEIYSNVTHRYEVPLKEHRVTPEECARCHGSYAALAEQTKGLKGPDGRWLGRNPHDSHWGKLDCGICHKMHRTSVDLCAGCHGLPRTGPAWTTPVSVALASTP